MEYRPELPDIEGIDLKFLNRERELTAAEKLLVILMAPEKFIWGTAKNLAQPFRPLLGKITSLPSACLKH